MAATDGEAGLEAFFALMHNEGGIIVQGASRFERLLLIGQCSPSLCVDSLKAAVIEAKKGKDVRRYREAWNYMRVAAPNDALAQLDKKWIDATEAANTAETKHLEKELKAYKNNLVKESIRMGHEELGKHLQSIGDLAGAAEAYNRMRPDVSTPKHIVDVGKHLVSVAIERRDWPGAVGHLNKVTGLQGSEEDKSYLPYLRSMTGLAYLGQSKYLTAAKLFLEVESSVSIAKVTGGMMTGNDVAVYGGLLALASMDRKDLQTKVLENSRFRSYLELEPHIRRAIAQFVNGRYAACLSILASYRPDYLLDLYLQKHVSTLYEQIRVKCISQYLIPFSCVTLASMDAAFAEPGGSVEEELATMIRDSVIDARIDSINRLVVTTKENPRVKMQRQGLDAFTAFNKEATERIRRMSLLAADLGVKGPRRQHAAMPDVSDSWYESSVNET
ncbi:cop9 signalosome subunit 1 [Grosmannia clavigera kw1407]|uniref:Cop9 signalosome subunit 1 n=1 Tax=Grosmannia clavigera (strain kw1407 / UAMH 11150) TaxID=655863 RepID=F0XFA0_GROCL|nr:cop9 signalosome subunit 1 [Grosmannia clavigera kw1407]EFX03593.1 cop9 signalosome subunit 1 [Grosmannia clavigera kw1407]